MQDNWVDFKAIKAGVSLPAVLARYQVNWLREKGDELCGRCPIHQGEGANSFHINLAKGAFNCFSCKAHGNVLDFVAAMEKCSVRDAAVRLKEWFSLTMPESGTHDHTSVVEKKGSVATKRERGAANKPLGFLLKGLDLAHPYLTGRGISRETVERFGTGFFPGKGSMAGRVVIPIHNERGDLVAYAGRSVDDSEPKYKLPTGFQKSLVLFNYHRVLKEVEAERPIVLVEGFFDCMKVDQAGFPALAMMGCSLSEAQEQLLVADFDRVIIMLDGDDAGRQAAEEISARLVRKMFVRVVDPGESKQPDQLSNDELRQLLGSL